MTVSADRVAGILAVVVAAAIYLVSSTYRVTFMTDPVGPRGLPLLVAIVFATGGVLLVLRPGGEPRWPTGRMLGRGGVVIAAFLGYAALLPRLGFFIATSLTVAVLSSVFGGPPVRSVLAAVVYAAVLWLLFAFGLGLPLPIGSWLGAGT